MKPTLVQSQVEYQSLTDDACLVLLRVFGADAVSRLYDVSLADVEKRSRMLEAADKERADAARSGRRRSAAILNRPDKHILEVCHEKCDFIRDIAISKGLGYKDALSTLNIVREIAATQKDINAALADYLRTKAAVDALLGPVENLPPEFADAVLAAWANNPELRLLMR